MADIHPCCMTIAGSDSGGNAGVQADLRAFHAYGLHGCTVLAALTAQNPRGVTAAMPVPPGIVAAQLDAVLGTYCIRALKTGMLAEAATIEVVADRLSARPEIAKVVDPVMVATSGAQLTSGGAQQALARLLLPLATLVTPNLPEAEALCGARGDAATLARGVYERFGCATLVKGGHAVGGDVVDVLYDGRGLHEFALPRVADPISTHGTGCTLAAAIAAELALGHDLDQAVAGAKRHVHAAISGSYLVGEDCGVLGFASGGEDDNDD